MGEVGVEGLTEGKVGGVVVNGGVYGGVGRGDVDMFEARDEFLKIANSLGAAGGVAEGVVEVVWEKLGV